MMRRAKIAQAGVRFDSKSLYDGLSDARLANTGLARDQDHLSVAVLRLPPATQEQFNLLAAANQRRSRRAQRLEPAFRRPDSQHQPRRHMLAEALECDGAKIAIVK